MFYVYQRSEPLMKNGKDGVDKNVSQVHTYNVIFVYNITEIFGIIFFDFHM